MSDRSPGVGWLALKIFLVGAVAVIAVVAAVTAARLALAPEPDRPAVDAVSRGWASFTAEQRDRYARLGLAARLLATEEALRGVLRGAGEQPEEPEEALADLLLQRRDELGYDFALVLDADGVVVAASDEPDLVGRDLSARPLVSRGLEEGTASGVWRRSGDRLAHAAVEWVAPEFDLLGFVLVGQALDDLLALEVQRGTGAGAAFVVSGDDGPRTVGASFDPAVAQGLLDAVAGPGGDAAAVIGSGDTREGVELELAGTPWEAVVAPLRDGRGNPAGAVIVAAPSASSSADPTWWWLAAGTAAALVLAALFALLLARGTLAPVRRLAGMVEASRREGFARRPEAGRAGHLAPLAVALQRLFRDLQEERALSAATLSVVRTDGDGPQAPAEGGGAGPREPEEIRATLVGVDLKRHARLGGDDEEPRRTGERLRRELVRLRGLAAERGGRLHSAAGHRVLLSFTGEDAEWRAMGAGASALAALSERESAFDEGEPPAVAVASGRGVEGGDLLVGPVVQLVDSLLREAAGGDLVTSRSVHRKVEERLREQGTTLSSQRGLLSPQPLFVLHAEEAERLAGSTGSADATPGGGLAPALPGELHEGRFEVISRVGGTEAGDLLRARDRELGDVVAVKRLAWSAVSAPEAAELDGPLGEVRRFSHPAVARLYDFGDTAGGLFLCREWVPGVPLQKVGELPLPAALAVARQLAAALAGVHAAGIHHGRVKPENLVLLAGAGLRLTDLGVALVAGPSPSATAGEKSLAPEQHTEGGDARSDVFAAGAVLAHLVTGDWWGSGDGEETAADHLPEGLAPVIRTCLAPDPAARYADGSELLEALEGISA